MSSAVRPAGPSAPVPAHAPSLAVRTVEIADPGPLLDLLPREAPLAWVREGEGLVGWGEAARIDMTGPARFAEASAWWDAIRAAAEVQDALELPGTGLIAFGAFEFADRPAPGHRGPSARLDGTVRPSTLIVPAVAIGRAAGRWWLTTAAPEGAPEPAWSPHSAARAPQDLRQPGPLSWSDGACTAAQWRAAVSQALARIGSTDLQKVVLARDRVAVAGTALDPRHLLRRLGELYQSCWTFSVDGFVGATPELLLRLRKGAVQSRVLAGTIRRRIVTDTDTATDTDADPAALAATLRRSVKDRREHEFSVRSVVEALGPHCTSLHVPEAPYVLTLPNVLHLASDISGQAAPGSTSLALAAALHPTAAVCGSPRALAAEAIEALEPMDRGRYAGPVGWLSASGDGEWGVALRCGQIDSRDPRRIRIFAGAGIVAQSDPAAELAETDAKLTPMVSALA